VNTVLGAVVVVVCAHPNDGHNKATPNKAKAALDPENAPQTQKDFKAIR